MTSDQMNGEGDGGIGYGLYQPGPRPSRKQAPGGAGRGHGARLWRMALWSIIAVATAGIIYLQSEAKQGASLDDAPPDPAGVSSFEVQFMGRYLVGWRFVEGRLGPSASTGGLGPAAVLAGIAEDAEDPISLIRLGVVSADVVGPEAGEAHLAEAETLLTGALEQDQSDPSLSEEALEARQQALQGLLEDIGALRTIYERGPDALDPADATRLKLRHRWFGELALTFGLDDEDPRREPLVWGGVRTLVAAVTFMTVAMLGVIGGVVLFIVAIVLLAKGRLRPMFARTSGAAGLGTSGLEGFALFLLGFIGLHVGIDLVLAARPEATWVGPVGILLNWLLALCAFWPMVRGVGWGRLSLAQGWTRGQGVWREAGAGVLGYLAGLPIVLGAIVMMLILLALMPEAKPSHPAIDGLAGAGWVELLVFLSLGVIWAPLVEESMFRGLLYHDLRRGMHPVVAALAVGFIFAIIHPQGVATVPVLMALAFSFAMIREWRGCLIGPVVAHALHNGTLLTFVALAMS